MSVRPSFLSALVSSLRSTIRAVSPPFGEEPCCSKWISPLSVRYRHHSVKSHGRVVSGFLKKSSFIPLQRTQTAMEYYCESLHHKKYHASSIHTIPSNIIAFIPMLYSGYVLFNAISLIHILRSRILIGRFEHNSLERLPAASGCMSSYVNLICTDLFSATWIIFE